MMNLNFFINITLEMIIGVLREGEEEVSTTHHGK